MKKCALVGTEATTEGRGLALTLAVWADHIERASTTERAEAVGLERDEETF